ncbi:hypothetical protein P7K49_021175 [Saguinus oedipus]|uniref:Uncharacterized protein n=1 Tax=Saguinus oedipus TaxID=9490 RepID=A0ABQ9URW8_SAGOE|nr:hypothetical protein P7K49_021175 [Saguinus oedipus]
MCRPSRLCHRAWDSAEAPQTPSRGRRRSRADRIADIPDTLQMPLKQTEPGTAPRRRRAADATDAVIAWDAAEPLTARRMPPTSLPSRRHCRCAYRAADAIRAWDAAAEMPRTPLSRHRPR